jgi:hypothetical protein
MAEGDPRHGTYPGYKAGCGDSCCLAAAARYERYRIYDQILGRPRLLPAVGVNRRVRALQVAGWPLTEIASRAGMDQRNLAQVLVRRNVNRRTYAAITAVYAELEARRGPSLAATRYAAAKGWAPACAWDVDTIDDPAAKPNYGSRTNTYTDIDPVAVERRLHGDRTVRLTVAERREAVRVGSQIMRLYDWQIAERLDIELRSVQRLRTQLGLTPASTRAIA